MTGTAAGTQNNTTGNVTSTEGGTGGTASASINVVAPPSIAKAFGASSIPLNGDHLADLHHYQSGSQRCGLNRSSVY